MGMLCFRAVQSVWGPTLNLVVAGEGVLQCRQEWGLDFQVAVLHSPHAVIQAARRRTAGVLAIFVIHAAVARAHEQARLRKPFHRAAQVRAIDGEHVEAFLIFSSRPKLRT